MRSFINFIAVTPTDPSISTHELYVYLPIRAKFLSMSSDGDYIAASDGETISVFEISLNENGKLRATQKWAERLKSQISAMAFGGNQNLLINSRSEVKIVNVQDKSFFKLRFKRLYFIYKIFKTLVIFWCSK